MNKFIKLVSCKLKTATNKTKSEFNIKIKSILIPPPMLSFLIISENH